MKNAVSHTAKKAKKNSSINEIEFEEMFKNFGASVLR